MTYELKKPYTDIEKADFIVQYNHKQGLRIEDTEQALYALEANEMMEWREVEETIKVEVEPAVYEDVEVFDTQQILVVDENGEPILDENGNLQYTEEKILIPAREYDVYETDEDGMTVFDEDGNPIVKEHVTEPEHYKSHIETVLVKEAVYEEQTITVQRLVPVINPNYEKEQAEKEAKRIAMLKLTRGDVFRGLLQARQVTRAMIRAQLEALPEETPEQLITKEMALIDFDEALDFYRGNPLIDTVGEALGITKEQLDKFFETKDYITLLPTVTLESDTVE